MTQVARLTGTILTVFLDEAAEDWAWTDLTGSTDSFLMVKTITFHPSAQNDKLILREAVVSTTSAIIFQAKAAADTSVLSQTYSPPLRCRPVFDISECTVTTGDVASSGTWFSMHLV